MRYGKQIDSFSNGENTILIYDEDGKIIASDGTYICDSDDPERDWKIDHFGEEWLEVNWSSKDWAEFYGED